MQTSPLGLVSHQAGAVGGVPVTGARLHRNGGAGPVSEPFPQVGYVFRGPAVEGECVVAEAVEPVASSLRRERAAAKGEDPCLITTILAKMSTDSIIVDSETAQNRVPDRFAQMRRATRPRLQVRLAARRKRWSAVRRVRLRRDPPRPPHLSRRSGRRP
jgi:hypothetical protein